MNKINYDKETHFNTSNSYAIDYCKSLKESNYSYTEVKFIKKNIFLFLEELKEKGDGSALNFKHNRGVIKYKKNNKYHHYYFKFSLVQYHKYLTVRYLQKKGINFSASYLFKALGIYQYSSHQQ